MAETLSFAIISASDLFALTRFFEKSYLIR